MDANLKLIGRDEYGKKFAMFQLSPHKRTLFFDYSISFSSLVKLPYVIFFFPYVELINREVCLDTFFSNHYTTIQVYFTKHPLVNGVNSLFFYSHRNICVGNISGLRTPEKNIDQLFLKIANLYFFTSFLPNTFPINLNERQFDLNWSTNIIWQPPAIPNNDWETTKQEFIEWTFFD